ncbi:MAG: phosphoribosylformylglycinamidine cyclo-ligase [Pseudomonadota bacterium]
MNNAYKQAGVDIDAGDRLVQSIKPLAAATRRPGADADLGGFGGLFDLKATGYSDPLLVSGTDGVGTKLKLAFALSKHDTIGIDLVAMCANDVLAQGAEPLFFLDYFATGKLQEGIAADVIAGIAAGCSEAGCALVGGETAEMPGMYAEDEYDLAGFCVGAVERDQVLPRPVEAGDVMIGLASSGPHANGFSLIRKIVDDKGLSLTDAAPFDRSRALGAALLEPTRLYVKPLLPILKNPSVRGFAHITGGGLKDNVPRILGPDQQAAFDDAALELPPLFEWLQTEGNLSDDDMRQTFNCGIGGVLIVSPSAVDSIIDQLNNAPISTMEDIRVIGHVEGSSR